MDRTILAVRRFAGILWFLSWFELYLEVFRFRHLRLPGETLATIPPIGSHPGAWLQTDIASSIVAPLLFLVMSFLAARRAGSSIVSRRPFPFALAAIAFGLSLGVFGTINQLIWRPPLSIDLTLRQGNTGFIVLGAAIACAGGVHLWRRRNSSLAG
jgi:LPXTG-motif cell wall-anchored protein